MSKYDDIIGLPHHVSDRHPPMSLHDRAAQFSPFAALTGYEDAIEETARPTDSRPELSESALAALDERLRAIEEHITDRPEISVTFFQADAKKCGGACITLTGHVKRIDRYRREMVFVDGRRVSIADITNIEGRLF